VFELVSAHPEIGAEAEDVELAGVRHVHMAATHHYFYYRVIHAERRIEVLAVWSTSRGDAPAL
jgi:plasmid stabilization system protein ParE